MNVCFIQSIPAAKGSVQNSALQQVSQPRLVQRLAFSGLNEIDFLDLVRITFQQHFAAFFQLLNRYSHMSESQLVIS